MINSNTPGTELKRTKHTKYSASERKAYYAGLREQWAKAKQAAIEHPDSFEAIAMELKRQGLNYSPMSAWFTKLEMSARGYDGLPYVDTKTFKGWQQSGFKVIKGEHSTIHGLVWMHPKSKDSNGNEVIDDEYVYPKVYNLFHRSQVQAIGTDNTPAKIKTTDNEAPHAVNHMESSNVGVANDAFKSLKPEVLTVTVPSENLKANIPLTPANTVIANPDGTFSAYSELLAR